MVCAPLNNFRPDGVHKKCTKTVSILHRRLQFPRLSCPHYHAPKHNAIRPNPGMPWAQQSSRDQQQHSTLKRHKHHTHARHLKKLREAFPGNLDGFLFFSNFSVLFRTRSTTTRDRNLQFRGAVSTGGSPLDYLLFLQVLCVI